MHVFHVPGNRRELETSQVNGAELFCKHEVLGFVPFFGLLVRLVLVLEGFVLVVHGGALRCDLLDVGVFDHGYNLFLTLM